MKRIEPNSTKKIYKVQYFMNVRMDRIEFSMGMLDIFLAGDFQYVDFFEHDGGLVFKPTIDSGWKLSASKERRKCDILRKGLVIHLKRYLGFMEPEFKMIINPIPNENGYYTVITRPISIKGQAKTSKLI